MRKIICTATGASHSLSNSMCASVQSDPKGKDKATATEDDFSSSEVSRADSEHPSTSSSSYSEDDPSPEYLESLLEKARQNAATKARAKAAQSRPGEEEELIELENEPEEPYAASFL
jgi:hypothetical protein